MRLLFTTGVIFILPNVPRSKLMCCILDSHGSDYKEQRLLNCKSQNFGGKCRLYHQGRNVSEIGNQKKKTQAVSWAQLMLSYRSPIWDIILELAWRDWVRRQKKRPQAGSWSPGRNLKPDINSKNMFDYYFNDTHLYRFIHHKTSLYTILSGIWGVWL
jgi:hypothetical protein